MLIPSVFLAIIVNFFGVGVEETTFIAELNHLRRGGDICPYILDIKYIFNYSHISKTINKHSRLDKYL